MKEVIINKDKFKFNDFTASILEFLKSWGMEVHPSYAIAMVEEPGDAPEYGPEEGRNNFLDELSAGNYLFFPFSTSNLDEPISCANGKAYKLDEESDFVIGDIDCVGFLIKLDNGNFIINSAVNAGGACMAPPPSVDITDCDIFDKPMKNYLNNFMIK